MNFSWVLASLHAMLGIRTFCPFIPLPDSHLSLDANQPLENFARGQSPFLGGANVQLASRDLTPSEISVT